MSEPVCRPAPQAARAAWSLAGLAAAVALAGGCATAPPPPGLDTSPVRAQHGASAMAEGWHHGAFMEVFVRAYQDSDGDGIGDLRGLISRLDYLKDLGIKGLWLMPVTASADRDHGYATTDFRAIERDYGSMADLDELLVQAHARGIGVIMDYVINHAAASHPMFVSARQDARAPFRDWFVWSDDAPPGWDIWGQNPWYHTASQPWEFKGPLKALPRPAADAKGYYFGTFGPHMPDFNFRNPAVQSYHFDSLRFWLNRGLDGYRLDAVPHLIENNAKDWNDQPESRRITKQVQDLIKGYPQRYVVCEATAKPTDYGDPQLCGGAFAFGYVDHFVKAAQGQPDSVKRLAEYYRTASPTMATFVSSHDIFAGKRLWDQVSGDLAQYKLSAAGYLLQPGTPFIYYGEEVGQAGVHSLQGDFPLRAPMSWTADTANAGFTTGQPFRPVSPNVATHNAQAQMQDPNGIHAFYKAMLSLRNTLPSIARGSFEHSFAEGLVLGFQRRWDQERTLVLINYGTTEATASVPGLSPNMALRRLYPNAPLGRDGGAAPLPSSRVTVPPQSVQVWRVLPG
ncbi:MAG: alpha-amylase [Ideonella sp.]|jgi:alpha-amylase|nr:alpha-amylase [Ideonella sp.]MBL0149875.1 alpha-amylase [Ideonella sp.]